MLNMRKGFTLVELLAVIVILGVIMVIAIPSVLNTLTVAKQKTFVEYVSRIHQAGLKQYLADESVKDLPDTKCTRTSNHTKPCYIDTFDTIEYFYDIETDLDLPDTGSFHGWVAIIPDGELVTEPTVLVGVYNDDYMTHTLVPGETEGTTRDRYYINYTLYGEPDVSEIITPTDRGIDSLNAAYVGNKSGDQPWGVDVLCENKITD